MDTGKTNCIWAQKLAIKTVLEKITQMYLLCKYINVYVLFHIKTTTTTKFIKCSSLELEEIHSAPGSLECMGSVIVCLCNCSWYLPTYYITFTTIQVVDYKPKKSKTKFLYSARLARMSQDKCKFIYTYKSKYHMNISTLLLKPFQSVLAPKLLHSQRTMG